MTAAAFTVAIVVGEILLGVILGPLAAFLAELFPTRVRFTGSSPCFELGSTLGAGFGPAVATSLILANGGGLGLMAGVWITVLIAGPVAVLVVRDGSDRPLS